MADVTFPADERRTLGDLTVTELVDSALSETMALDKVVDRIADKLDYNSETLILRAYIGSIVGRLANAQMKLGG